MKKFLSLALALIMTMSLVTISTSAADFTDDESIQYVEAVEVMAALEVIGGYADGSFAPSATLTRGAAAKIICNMILGPTVAGALNADAAPFPDVAANHVFAGYIAYCAKEGIIGGYADGTFRADGTVTGDQFMKMLLGALGYDASIEGFTGANWSVSVVKLANSLGMADGNDDFVGTAAMTREEACLYAFNTLTTTMVEYDNNSSITVGDIVITNSSKAEDVKNTTTKYQAIGAGDGFMQFCEKHFKKLKLDDATSASSDAFGRPVQTWKYDNNKIGAYINDETLIAAYEGKVTKATMYDLLGKDLIADLDVVGAPALTVEVDGKTQTSAATNYAVKNSTAAAMDTGASSVTEVYMDSAENVTIVVYNSYVVQAAADYNTKNEELRIDALDVTGIANTIKNDDINVEDFEEDDYILVTIANDVVKSVALAEVITGTVGDYVIGNSVDVEDVTYNYALMAPTAHKDYTYTVGEDAVMVLDQFGNIIYVDDMTVASDRYVFISEYANAGSLSSSGVVAAAYFVDGTYEEIVVKQVLTTKTSTTSASGTGMTSTLGSGETTGWYTYSTDADGKYTLTEVESKYAFTAATGTPSRLTPAYTTDTTGAVVTSGQVAFTSGLKGNSSTVFVMVDADNEVTTYTGVNNVADVKNMTSGQTINVYALNKGGYAAFVLVDASGAADASFDSSEKTSTDYMFVLPVAKKVGEDVNDNTYWIYKAIVDGEVVDVKTASYSLTEGVVYNNVKTNANGYITKADALATATNGVDGDDILANIGLSSATNSYAGDVLTIGSDSMIVDGAEVIIVSKQGVSFNENGDAKYEINYAGNAKGVYNTFEGTLVSGNFFAVTDEDNSQNVTTMFIYVSANTGYTVTNTNDSSMPANITVTFDTNVAAGENVDLNLVNGNTSVTNVNVWIDGSMVKTVSLPAKAGDISGTATYTFVMPAANVNIGFN